MLLLIQPLFIKLLPHLLLHSSLVIRQNESLNIFVRDIFQIFVLVENGFSGALKGSALTTGFVMHFLNLRMNALDSLHLSFDNFSYFVGNANARKILISGFLLFLIFVEFIQLLDMCYVLSH